MVKLAKKPQIRVVLVSLVLGASFAWGSSGLAAAQDENVAIARAEPAADPGEFNAWLYAGLGFGAAGFAGNGIANIKYGKFLVAVYATADGVFTWGAHNRNKDVGFVLGYYPLPKLGFAGGVASVAKGKFYETGWFSGYWEYSYTVGIPVEVRYSPVKSRIVGLGLVGHVNFNDEEIFGNFTAGIELGKLK